MKDFMLLTVGFDEPTPDVMQAWGKWFASIQDRITDQAGFNPGREISAAGTRDMPYDKNAITGYLIIQAHDMAEAEKIASACPVITSTLVYEIRAHK